MTREELNEATAQFLEGGGKIKKLPEGPAFRWYPYSAMSRKGGDLSIREDLTVKEEPANATQEAAAGYTNTKPE
tara:strand:- start:245 stop:466 length:222 start_codon:yes stop_codon:yes gene_type:complete